MGKELVHSINKATGSGCARPIGSRPAVGSMHTTLIVVLDQGRSLRSLLLRKQQHPALVVLQQGFCVPCDDGPIAVRSLQVETGGHGAAVSIVLPDDILLTILIVHEGIDGSPVCCRANECTRSVVNEVTIRPVRNRDSDALPVGCEISRCVVIRETGAGFTPGSGKFSLKTGSAKE